MKLSRQTMCARPHAARNFALNRGGSHWPRFTGGTSSKAGDGNRRKLPTQ